MKTLCFTTSYNRPYFLYNCINNLLNQTYKDITYNINIAMDNLSDADSYKILLQDFLDDNRLNICFNLNSNQQTNYLNAIQCCDINNYDLFVKIDDDDIYHKNYLLNGINKFLNNDADIISFISSVTINNGKIEKKMHNIGYNPLDEHHKIKFGMPSTYFFNKRALDCILPITNADVRKIHLWEDVAWRESWRKQQLISIVYDENNMMIYNIHGKNISSNFLLKEENDSIFIDNNRFMLCLFKHPHWTSHIYLDKQYNIAFLPQSNNYGNFTIQNDLISIKWIAKYHTLDKFLKKQSNNTIYYNYVS